MKEETIEFEFIESLKSEGKGRLLTRLKKLKLTGVYFWGLTGKLIAKVSLASGNSGRHTTMYYLVKFLSNIK